MVCQEENRLCNLCLVEKPLAQFQNIKQKDAKRRICYSCRYKRESADKEAYKVKMARHLKSIQASRLNPTRRAKHIRDDMARSDRKKGWAKHDLPIAWIDEQISKPCSYCKQRLSKTEMTLDRVDNTIGHTKENLVPACKMCNYFRRDMPYDAWMVLAQNMPKIVKLGMLKGWSAGAGFRGKRKEIKDEKQGV